MILHNQTNRKELKTQLEKSQDQRFTLSFYKYAHIEDPQAFRDSLYLSWVELSVLGRVYIAKEGINAQISVLERNFEQFKENLYQTNFLNGVYLNIAVEDSGKSFFQLKIKVKNKIVADGLQDEAFDVTDKGVHLNAKDFNELTEDPNTIIVDMRNHYESEVGHFENAYLPDVDTFKEALDVVEHELEDKKDKNIVMYCTGGIRCEKASAYYKHKGFKNVFQLRGGIIEYARQVKEEDLDNKFVGKNFVFDERLGERISDKVIAKCHQCGTPCDTHVNCANEACHLLFIQCEQCAKKYSACCSTACQDFIALPLETQKTLRKGKKTKYNIFKKGRFELMAGKFEQMLKGQ